MRLLGVALLMSTHTMTIVCSWRNKKNINNFWLKTATVSADYSSCHIYSQHLDRANNVDPDQMTQNVVSDQDLCINFRQITTKQIVKCTCSNFRTSGVRRRCPNVLGK